MIFNLPPILGLAPLVLYIILAFQKNMHPIVNVGICVLLGAILSGQSIGSLGTVVYESMGSFLALVGFIIMLGSGLGVVLRKTGVAENIVHLLMQKIGVKTQKRAILATMVSSIVLVTLLGTLAGANAIIAPIVIPLVAAVGLTPSTLAVIFQGAGQTGLFLSPFGPPMVTLMQITGLSYPRALLCAGLPVAVVMWIGTYIMAVRIQKQTQGKEHFEDEAVEQPAIPDAPVQISKATVSATLAFALVMLAMVVWGIATNGGAAFVILVMIAAWLITGVVGGMSPGKVIDAMMEGCGKMFWIFFMFLLFNPFLNFVTESGGFDALVDLVEPYITVGGVVGFAIIVTFIGIFGINGAAVAQAMMIDTLFHPFLGDLGVSMSLWATIVLVGSQITSFAYPGLDMIGQMGLAHAKDIKPMMKLAYMAIIPGTLLVVIAECFIL